MSMYATATTAEEHSSVAPLFAACGSIRDGDVEHRRTSRAIARAAAGDDDAMRYLYQRYSGKVYGYVRSVVHDEHEAQDITQTVFLKLMRTLHLYDARQGHFSAWILRVARNQAIDHIRRRQPILAEEVRPTEAQADDGDAERAEALREALAGLSDDQRTVLVLRQVVGLRPGEIAARLSKTEGSVHALHHRARAAVRASLLSAGSAPATVRK